MNVFLDDTVAPVGERGGVLGYYQRMPDEMSANMRIGSRYANKKNDDLFPFAADLRNHNVALGYKAIVRHEYGHHVQLKLLDRDESISWQNFYREKIKQDNRYFERHLSTYAATNHKEAFAEAFCAYTSPKYSKSKNHKLTKEIKDKLEELIGKREDL